MAVDMKPNAKLAAVMGSLVGMKNVATHKSISLTIHCPVESAQAVLQVFGWPTMVDPVPVAIARLEESPAVQLKREWAAIDSEELLPAKEEPVTKRETYTPPRHWQDLLPAAQTGIIRNERAFWAFAGVKDVEGAQDYIRKFCGVPSCADIAGNKEAEARWAQLQVRYGAWLREHQGAA